MNYMDDEIWKGTVGFRDYEVSNYGRVRRAKPLVCAKHPDGHIQVVLVKDGKHFTKKVHQLVAEAFIGPRLPGIVVNHKDFNRSNNRVCNLEYLTQKMNLEYSTKAGRMNRGRNNGQAKLSEKDIKQIRHLHRVGYSQRKMSMMFPVSRSCISIIVNKKTWSHL